MAQILVVDDSSTMREIVSGFLTQNGFDVAVANDGRAGLQLLQEDNGIKLVVSDINMPNMDGLTMADKIRTELGNTAVRIVMLTTETADSKKAEGQAAGAKAWVTKPFKPEQLLGVVQKLVLP